MFIYNINYEPIYNLLTEEIGISEDINTIKSVIEKQLQENIAIKILSNKEEINFKLSDCNENKEIKNHESYYLDPILHPNNKKENQFNIKLTYDTNINTLKEDIEVIFPLIKNVLLYAIQVETIKHYKVPKDNIQENEEINDLDIKLFKVQNYLKNTELEKRVQEIKTQLCEVSSFREFKYNYNIFNNSDTIRLYNVIKKYSHIDEYLSLSINNKNKLIKIINNKTNDESKHLNEETIIIFLEKLDKIKDIKLSNLKRQFDKMFVNKLIKPFNPRSIMDWDKPKEEPSDKEIQRLKEYCKTLKFEYNNGNIKIKENYHTVAEIIYEEFNESVGYFGNHITETEYNKLITGKTIRLLYVSETEYFKNLLVKRLTEHLKNNGYTQIIDYRCNFKTDNKRINKDFYVINI